MKFINRIVDFGVDSKLEDSINTKIKLANILNLALIVIIAFYSVIAALVVPELVPYCLYGFAAYSLNLFLSYLRFNLLTRFIMSILPALVIGMLHAVIMQAGDSIMKEVYAFQIVGSLIAFSLFDHKRIRFWLPAFIIAAIPILYIHEWNDFFDVAFDNSPFQQAWVRNSVLFGAFFLGGFLFVFLQRLNQKEFDKAQELTNRFAVENKKALEKEKELEQSLEKLEEAQQEEKKRAWATKGLAEIGSILREQEDLNVLTDQIISFIVKYLEANQGALFLIDEKEDNEEVQLSLKSAYAFKRKKKIHQKVNVGEGLIGQCYLEKDYIYLTEVPENFINITSGLGDANPRSILITPLMVNEEVYGVFEIASFKEIEQYQIDFMLEMGENIAMQLNSIKNNEKTKLLLAEMQEQSQQLHSQEEEMRQNMEELQATQEQTERQEQELRAELEMVQKEKAALEEKLQQKELEVQSLKS
ncbi:GAF domain-containing protein [Marivirga arenosa]|uniref:GAF domain-containing protein n=1 Tax=Marivirga arenosa TaxID=3059076 RepID=A0AA49J9U2_9BACT|nr:MULTISPECIES: GAF domain-containing protein [unclassified Marivirga]WKK82967.1 GAF domain-containing protein [Marivirga sp. BKB1-2]WMN07891.1 GAF domain-containing protein [Marivirga sp. ABR2-2]